MQRNKRYILVLDEKKNNKKANSNTCVLSNVQGITLIALVITVIIMVILAGVSLNATIGENGILTKAQSAIETNTKAEILESLNTALMSFNVNSILDNPSQVTEMLENLIDKELVDTVLTSKGEYLSDASSPMGIPQFDENNNYTGYIDYAVKKKGYSIIISVDDDGIYIAKYGDINISSGGSVAGGTTLVTADAFKNGGSPEEMGKFIIDKDASLMFVDQISGELSIFVKSGVKAKIYIFKDMTLTNKGIKRSAIDIESDGILELYVANNAKLTVDSGYSTQGATGNMGVMKQNQGGQGGYAGIHVPEGATLGLYGSGTVIAFGGNASAGGAGTSDYEFESDSGNGGGRRWRSWSWHWTEMVVMVENLIPLVVLLTKMAYGDILIQKEDMTDMQEKIVVM